MGSNIINPDKALLHKILNGEKVERFNTSPFGMALGLKIIDVEPELVRLEFSPDESFLQGGNVLQGGVVTSMLDFSMAFSCLVPIADNQSVATTSLSLNFLRPALAGKYVAEGRVQKLGRQVAFSEAKLFNEQQKLVATATSSLQILTLS
jgi:uncharacterized protein (TIGR00369 family)